MTKKDDPKSFARFMRRLTTPIHRGLYRLTGGRLGGKAVGMPILLLTTTGRKSGKPRTRPVGYLPDGDTYVVVAAAGGVPQHPDWYLNLRDNPSVTTVSAGMPSASMLVVGSITRSGRSTTQTQATTSTRRSRAKRPGHPASRRSNQLAGLRPLLNPSPLTAADRAAT